MTWEFFWIGPWLTIDTLNVNDFSFLIQNTSLNWLTLDHWKFSLVIGNTLLDSTIPWTLTIDIKICTLVEPNSFPFHPIRWSVVYDLSWWTSKLRKFTTFL
jgi:hypothetical protein